MLVRAINGSGGGGGDIAHGTIPDSALATANQTYEIDTGLTNIERFELTCSQGNCTHIVSYLPDTAGFTAGKYTAIRVYQNGTIYTRMPNVGSMGTYMTIADITGGKVTIKAETGYVPNTDIEWVAV